MLAAFVLSAAAFVPPQVDFVALEMSRFPSLEECNKAIADGEAHESHWRQRLDAGLCRHDQMRVEAYLTRVHEVIGMWRVLRSMWFSCNYTYGKERYWPAERDDLKDLLGAEAFASGWLPYPVAPHWRLPGEKKTVEKPAGWL